MLSSLIISATNGFLIVGVIGVIGNFLLATYLFKRTKRIFGVKHWDTYNPSLAFLYIIMVGAFIRYLAEIGGLD